MDKGPLVAVAHSQSRSIDMNNFPTLLELQSL
jgi:hypothetical protein